MRTDRVGGVVTITLSRPDRHNALGSVEVGALLEAFDRAEGDDTVRVVVLTGEGPRTFCAGASLDEMESGDMDEHRFELVTDRLTRLIHPTICALNGSAYGGGAELALCCDFRIGRKDMKLAVPAARLGVCYPPGGLERYARRLGQGVTARLLLAAEELDGAELYRVGYLTHLAEDVGETARALADRLSTLAPLALRSMKEVLLDAARGTVDRERAHALVERCSRSDDLREGLRARREGRSPDFHGR